MTRIIEFTVFLALACGLLLWVARMWHVGPPPAAGEAVAGSARLGGASGELAALVESWQTEPVTGTPSDLASVPPDTATPHAESTPDPTPERAAPTAPQQPTRAPTAPASTPTEADPLMARADVMPPTQPTAPSLSTPSTPATPRHEAPSAPQDLPPTSLAPAVPMPSDTQVSPRQEEPEPERDDDTAPVFAAVPMDKPTPPPQARRHQETPQRARRRDTRQAQPSAPSGGQVTRSASAPSGEGRTATQPSPPSAGSGGAAPAPTFSAAAIASAKAAYLAAVKQAVARQKRYPRRAERRGITGVVHVTLTLGASGQLIGARIARSSGAGVLDDAALEATRKARYPSIPPEMGTARLSVTVPIGFRRR